MIINTIKHLAFVLKVTPSEIQQIIDNIDQFYYEKIELKKNKDGSPKLDKFGSQKKRILHPSILKLKIIQQRILKDILVNLPLSDYAYGAVKGRDNVKNGRRHKGNYHVFTTDLKDFFPSIRHPQVFEMFQQFGFSSTVSRALTQLTTYKGKIPQGAPTSPAVANLVFTRTGKKLQEIARMHHLTFTAFIDDLTFSSPKDFKDTIQQIIKVITDDGFRISHSKTNYKTKDPAVTGIVLKRNSLSIPETLKQKISKPHLLTLEQIRGLQAYAAKVLSA
jgi:RNA-directed DNA polymerase